MTTAVVVGSGPNGLTAAIRLAQERIDVTVLEAYARPGGGTRTSELDDGRAGVLSRDLDLTLASLGDDARSWRRLFEPLTDRFDLPLDDIFRPIVHLPKHPVALIGFGLHALLPATWTARRWDDEPARALYMGQPRTRSAWLDTPLSGSVGLMLTAAGHRADWSVAKGGTESIPKAMIGLLTEFGGTVKTGVTMTSLDQVRDLDGRTPDVVMLGTAPDAVTRIVGDRLPSRVRRAFDRYRFGPAVFKVDFAIEGDVPWTNEHARRAGTLHLGGQFGEIAAARQRPCAGRCPTGPFVLVGQQYLADPSRSAGSANPLWSYAHVPHAFTGDATEQVVRQIERFAPGFRQRILATATRSAPEMATYNANYVGGDISAGANTAKQIARRRARHDADHDRPAVAVGLHPERIPVLLAPDGGEGDPVCLVAGDLK